MYVVMKVCIALLETCLSVSGSQGQVAYVYMGCTYHTQDNSGCLPWLVPTFVSGNACMQKINELEIGCSICCQQTCSLGLATMATPMYTSYPRKCLFCACREQQGPTVDEALDELEELQSEGLQEASMRSLPQLQAGAPRQTM